MVEIYGFETTTYSTKKGIITTLRKKMLNGNIVITIAKVKNHPHTAVEWARKYYPTMIPSDEEFIVTIGQNNTTMWSHGDLMELGMAIQRAIEIMGGR